MTGGLPLIVTRPEPGGAASAARARDLGLDVHQVPLFAAHALAWTPPDPAAFDALLITSAQVLRLAGAGLAQLLSLPVYAVGAATAAAAEAAGFSIAVTGHEGGQELLDAMMAKGAGNILWLCGRERSDLGLPGLELHALPCYAVDAVDPPAAWHVLTAQPAVISAYSVRAARRIADLAGSRRAYLSLVAISDAVAQAAGSGWAARVAAGRPDEATLLAEAYSLCNKRQ